MITCPACGSPTSVIATRSGENYLRRRRVCDECKNRVTTIEAIVMEAPHGPVVIVPRRELEALARFTNVQPLTEDDEE